MGKPVARRVKKVARLRSKLCHTTMALGTPAPSVWRRRAATRMSIGRIWIGGSCGGRVTVGISRAMLRGYSRRGSSTTGQISNASSTHALWAAMKSLTSLSVTVGGLADVGGCVAVPATGTL